MANHLKKIRNRPDGKTGCSHGAETLGLLRIVRQGEGRICAGCNQRKIAAGISVFTESERYRVVRVRGLWRGSCKQ